MKNPRTLFATALSLVAINLAIGADDKIILHLQDAAEIVSISQFFTKQGKAHLVAATLDVTDRANPPKSSLRLIDFQTGETVSELSVEQAPLVSPPGPQEGILAMPQLAPDIQWKLFAPDAAMTALQLKKDLPGYAVVTQILQADSGYYVFGMNLEQEPIISLFDEQLNLRIARADSNLAPGMITGAFALGSEIVALISSEKGAVLLRMSDELQTIAETRLQGFGADGVALRDGGYAISYVTIPDMVVLLERFDAAHNPLWKMPLYTMSTDAVSSSAKLAPLPGGIAFAGFNSDQLLIGKISFDSKDMTLKLGSDDGLEFDPNPSSYFLFAHETSIHVWGLGMNAHTFKNNVFHAEYK